MARVQLEVTDRVAWVTFHGRGPLNLLGGELIEGLSSTLDGLAGDSEVRSVVLQGGGTRAFSAGVDLQEMKGFSPQQAEGFISLLHQTMRRVMTLPKPVLASVRGPCLGGAMELAMACDLVLASEDAVFGLPEIRVGIPSVIEAALLSRLVGWARARELILTGQPLDAEKALDWGLVNRLVPSQRLREQTHAMATAFHSIGPRALAVQKEIIDRWLNTEYEQACRFSIKAFALCFAGKEPREAMEAFLEKRTPRF